MKSLKPSLITLAALALVLAPSLAHAHPYPVTTGRAHATAFHDRTPTGHDRTPVAHR